MDKPCPNINYVISIIMYLKKILVLVRGTDVLSLRYNHCQSKEINDIINDIDMLQMILINEISRKKKTDIIECIARMRSENL